MKKVNIRLALMALIAMVAVGFGATRTVAADDDIGATSTMTVSPMNQQVILAPGEIYSGVIKISNPSRSSQNLEYSVVVGSFSQYGSENDTDDYAQIDLATTSSYNQIMDWITLSHYSGTLVPNETDEVVYTIRVPMDAPAGGQYATIIFTNETPQAAAGESEGTAATVQDTVQMASIIYAEVTGVTRNEGEITENSIPAIVLSNTLEARSMVRNNGNVHTRAEYILQVWPMGSDEEICTNEENVATEFMMPETEKYKIQECKLPRPGIYKVKQTVRIFGEESITEQTVVYCPIWLMLIVIFVIILIVVMIAVKVRKKND